MFLDKLWLRLLIIQAHVETKELDDPMLNILI